MKNTLLIFILISLVSPAVAQRKVYELKSGAEVSRMIPFQERFLYPAFMPGQVKFRNGRTTPAQLNYSFLHGEVMFINLRKDTLLFSEQDKIDYVYIGKDIFYYYPKFGHFYLTNEFGNVKLGKKEVLARFDEEKYSAYGQYTSTSAISTYSSMVSGSGQMQFLNINNKILLKKRVLFFLVDKNNRFYIATRYNLIKLFPGQKRVINEFLKDNSIDLEKEPDLHKTLEFCAGL